MKVYFAGYSGYKAISDIPEAQYLLGSYLEFQKKDYVAWHKERKLDQRDLFLDSGAFSAFTRGAIIDIDEYISFIKRNQSVIDVYATLDVIGDWKKTRENTEYMESKGLKPLAAFHFMSPDDELRRMVKKYEYFALGGLVPLAMKRSLMRDWLDHCFSIIKTESKIHGLGVNAMWAWQRYPFYSCDATSWLKWAAYRRGLRYEDFKLKPIEKQSEQSVLTMNAHLGAAYLNRYNISQYNLAAKDITKLWELRGVKWNNSNSTLRKS